VTRVESVLIKLLKLACDEPFLFLLVEIDLSRYNWVTPSASSVRAASGTTPSEVPWRRSGLRTRQGLALIPFPAQHETNGV
jgi:hypothetical protein